MPNLLTRRVTNALTALFGVSVAALAFSGTARAELIFGLGATANAPNLLFAFDSATPGIPSIIGNITGLTGSLNETVVGIDIRPNDRLLYAVTNDGGVGRIYQLNRVTAAATPIATLFANPTDLTNPYTGLVGANFGVDFNPTGPVALRIVSNTGQNLRVGNPLTGTTFTDTDLVPGLSGAGYTNNDVNPGTGTTLYYLNSATDSLQLSNTPNTGPVNDVGAVGADFTDVLGFDIAGASTAYAALNIVGGGGSTFHTLNLGTGAATEVGAFNGELVGTVRGITASISAPEPGTVALLAFGAPMLLGAMVKRRKK